MVSNKKKDLGNKPGIFGHNQMHYIEIDLFIRMSIHTVLWVTIPSFFLRKFPCCFHHTVVYLPLHKLYRYKWIRSIFFWCSTVSCSVPPLLVVAGGVILFLVIIPIRRVYCNVRVLPTKFVGDIWPINAPDVFFLHLAQNSNIIFVACTSHSTPWHSVSKLSYKEIVCWRSI